MKKKFTAKDIFAMGKLSLSQAIKWLDHDNHKLRNCLITVISNKTFKMQCLGILTDLGEDGLISFIPNGRKRVKEMFLGDNILVVSHTYQNIPTQAICNA